MSQYHSKNMYISICVITYQRPEGLKRLLDGLNKLVFHELEMPEIEVVLVDNDPTGSAFTVVEQIKTTFQWPLKTAVEPQKGISFARNRSVALVSEAADFVAMIDDDEVPQPDWLERLLITQQQYSADIVTGPVIAHYEEDNVPLWIKQGKFFSLDLEQHKTGELMHIAFTGNVLIRQQILIGLNQIFDERFALTGGEDTYLFMSLYQAGYKIVWANDAVVYEWIPKKRVNPRWILMRGYRCWSSYSLVEREIYPSFKRQALRFAKGCGLITLGLIKLPPAFVRGKLAVMEALLYLFRGTGTFAGLLSIHYKEYKH